MKLPRRILETGKPLFREGKPLHRLEPIFSAMEHVFLGASDRTQAAPHIRDPLDIKRYMSMVIIALFPVLFASVYFFGLRVLVMIAVSYAAGGAAEVFFAIVRKDQIKEGFLVTGLLFPLVLPPGLPLWMVAVGVVFGVVVGKELFGGTGRNIFNPALVGRCFLLLSYSEAMSHKSWVAPVADWPGRLGQYAVDSFSGATPLAAGDYSWQSVANMFFGNVSGCVGETSVLAVIAGGIFLCVTRVANWRTVAAVLGSFTILTAVLHQALPHVVAPVHWQLLGGGLMLGVFFMATDPVTSPSTSGGKWACGCLIGILTVLIRGFAGTAEGVMYAILLGNIAAPILDEVVVHYRLRRLRSEA